MGNHWPFIVYRAAKKLILTIVFIDKKLYNYKL